LTATSKSRRTVSTCGLRGGTARSSRRNHEPERPSGSAHCHCPDRDQAFAACMAATRRFVNRHHCTAAVYTNIGPVVGFVCPGKLSPDLTMLIQPIAPGPMSARRSAAIRSGRRPTRIQCRHWAPCRGSSAASRSGNEHVCVGVVAIVRSTWQSMWQ